MRAGLILGVAALLTAEGVQSEVLPQPGEISPRIQSVHWRPGETVLLTMLPRGALTVMLEPGEHIRTVTVSDRDAWRVSVSSEADSFQIVPPAMGAPGSLQVATDRRDYRFGLRVDQGLTAAYLVRFEFAELPSTNAAQTDPRPSNTARAGGEWRLGGDREVRPLSVSDDGKKTTIAYATEQALPAVMAIGPTGEEEVVNGYMRGDVFVIDRVHRELVFRIDKKRATARRQESAR